MKYVMTEAVVQEGMALLDQEDTVYVAHDANPANYTEEMKTAAAYALAEIIPEEELKPDYIIPSAFYPNAADIVADAVEKAWDE